MDKYLFFISKLFLDGHVKGVGELMLASFPPLAHNFGRSVSIRNPWYDKYL